MKNCKSFMLRKIQVNNCIKSCVPVKMRVQKLCKCCMLIKIAVKVSCLENVSYKIIVIRVVYLV